MARIPDGQPEHVATRSGCPAAGLVAATIRPQTLAPNESRTRRNAHHHRQGPLELFDLVDLDDCAARLAFSSSQRERDHDYYDDASYGPRGSLFSSFLGRGDRLFDRLRFRFKIVAGNHLLLRSLGRHRDN